MRTYVFLDLDDTILQTLPKCPEGEPVWPAACARDGSPLSFMTQRQQTLLSLFSREATVIPTTARNLDAFRRVQISFPGLAILDFGGVVLQPDGTPDPAWDQVVRPQTERAAAGLHHHLMEARRFIETNGLGINARLVADFDMPLYVVLKHPGGDVAALRTVRRELWASVAPADFFIHENGNNLSLVPRFLGKERAVQHVITHLLPPEAALTIGVGDSLSDAPFLQVCDFALLPRGCQLARQVMAGGEGT